VDGRSGRGNGCPRTCWYRCRAMHHMREGAIKWRGH
jgi:hypothetical protein